MKYNNSILILLLATFVMVGFQNKKSIKGTWSLVKFYDAENKLTLHKPKEEKWHAPYITFDDLLGKATGITTINRFSANYTASSTALKFDTTVITEICETGWAKDFVNGMFLSATYHFKADSLVFSHSNGDQLFWVSVKEENE